MARIGVTKTRMFLLRAPKQVSLRCMSKVAKVDSSESNHKERINSDKRGYWFPHARTGIYIPEGHEWVMDDVPDGAATMVESYWLRNIDGVDKPETYYASSDLTNINLRRN